MPRWLIIGCGRPRAVQGRYRIATACHRRSSTSLSATVSSGVGNGITTTRCTSNTAPNSSERHRSRERPYRSLALTGSRNPEGGVGGRCLTQKGAVALVAARRFAVKTVAGVLGVAPTSSSRSKLALPSGLGVLPSRPNAAIDHDEVHKTRPARCTGARTRFPGGAHSVVAGGPLLRHA